MTRPLSPQGLQSCLSQPAQAKAAALRFLEGLTLRRQATQEKASSTRQPSTGGENQKRRNFSPSPPPPPPSPPRKGRGGKEGGERSFPFLSACALKGRLRAEGARCANLSRGGQHTRASPPPLLLRRPLPRKRRGGSGCGLGMCPSPPEPWRHQADARSSWQVCAPSRDGFRGGEGSRCGDVLLSQDS